jgi:serine/threonine-protein kinase
VGRDVVGPARIATPCLVEEYVDGLDLGELDALRRNALERPLPLWAVSDLVAQAARGLHAAHQVGVVHRDVKPANLFADAALRVRVGDFGIAVAPREQRAFQPAGTPLFMAPEQLAEGTADRRADVFSLGATAYALRYGAPPWADSGALIRGEKDATFPAPRSAEEAFFQHLVRTAMAHDPAARPATARQLEHGLSALARSARPRLTCARLGPGAYAVGSLRVTVEVGDLAEVGADGIVNSAYSELRMDQGVGLSLKRAGGDVIEAEAMRGGAQALGACVETSAGALPCRSVLHAVGAWNEVSCVARALLRALWIAEHRSYRSLALPAIGTGRGKVSLASSADTIATCLRTHAELGGRLREARVVVIDAQSAAVFDEILAGVLLHAEPDPDDDDAAPLPSAHTLLAPTAATA